MMAPFAHSTLACHLGLGSGHRGGPDCSDRPRSGEIDADSAAFCLLNCHSPVPTFFQPLLLTQPQPAPPSAAPHTHHHVSHLNPCVHLYSPAIACLPSPSCLFSCPPPSLVSSQTGRPSQFPLLFNFLLLITKKLHLLARKPPNYSAGSTNTADDSY